MLMGTGAVAFARSSGFVEVEDPANYYRLPVGVTIEDVDGFAHGTVGAVALDTGGALAAATSTGGVVNKRMGRVGDSPIIGAGVYADNETCAVSATGYGEDFMRSVIAKTIADFIDMKGMNAQQATQAGIDYLTRKVKGRGRLSGRSLT